jgi:tight adherence protein B
MQLIAPVVVFLGVLVFFFGLRSMLQRNEEIEARLDRLAQTNRIGVAAAAELRGRTEARMTQQLTGNLNRAIAKQTFAQNLATGLARADLKMTPAEFLIMRLIISVVAGILGYLLAVVRELGAPPLFAILGFILGYYLVGFWLRRRQARRLKAFNDQLADTLVLIANSLRSGYSLLQSLDLVSREAQQPTAGEYLRVVREVGLGLSPEEALGNLVRRVASNDLDLVVTAINVQFEVGGNLSQILETIGHTIRERVRIKGEITTLTAQQQYTGYLISAVPVFIAFMLYLINPGYILELSRWPWLIIPGCALIMLGIGFYAIRRITAIEV